ncbi:uncharacterized protein EV422DRAFT_552259 [Fimicolochytrium jonesii]|uniref:uncharacterized protein n=1 Tax=Fimicolochytrium jonesii TaxID=1396493 RepID=UPI0022FE483C|nr:uncharacterized protein EV422DRAFT_552259 [Fimicolochytrium jonesii]KAI8826849.1 hypothetical protein EV422DRAFT_552259 [Fimicolochytrium jonesii]
MRQQRIVILGAGISGLSAAWYLARYAGAAAATRALPPLKITVVEKQPRVGGWVQTLRNNGDDGDVFELGPRTLRPVGVPGATTLEMVHKLNLQPHLLTTSKTSPAALNRYIYAQNSLHHLPTSPLDLLLPWRSQSHSPLLKGILPSILREPFVKPRPPPPDPETGYADESVHSFVSRRFGVRVADNLVSAVLHGIYAGDARRLSVRSVMPVLWDAESRSGSVIRGLVAPAPPKASVKTPFAIGDGEESAEEFIADVQKNASIYSFKGGVQTLTDALKTDLLSRNSTDVQVEILQGTVDRLDLPPNPDSPANVHLTSSPTPLRADHIISSLAAWDLQRLLPPTSPLIPLLDTIKGVTVGTVNYLLRGAPTTVLPVNGFGYLVPITERTPILGTVFDSCAMPVQDVRGDTTRVTVMLGGHKFSEFFGAVDKKLSPETVRAIEHASEVAIHSHLQIPRLNTQGEPVVLNRYTAVHRDCIPQYTVGHRERLGRMHGVLVGGRMSVCGASYGGVGVNDCVVGARDLVRGLVERGLQGAGKNVSGLEKFAEE